MELGQKVRLCRLRDRASQNVIDRLGQVGTIEEYKMVDGSGVGFVVRFEGDKENFSAWFFEDELQTVS